MTKPKNILNTTSFYDQIAEKYNSNMTEEDSRTRSIVREQFLQLVPKGNVLDFGAGTGTDLTWLVANKSYEVFALEPSTGMRDIAKESVKQIQDNSNLRFIDFNTDFKTWTKHHLPFPEKMDGVLANFAVLNHINELEVLFEQMCLICNTRCILIALVLTSSFTSIKQNYSLVFALKNLLNSKITVLNKHNEALRETYLYSTRTLCNAARNHFILQSSTHIPSTEFDLVIFRRP